MSLSEISDGLTLDELLEACLERGASDLYLTFGSPPCLRVEGEIEAYSDMPMTDWDIQNALKLLLKPEQIPQYHEALELNTSFYWEGRARFRINVFRQQQHDAIVLRHVQTKIPTIDELSLPDAYRNLAMMKRGLVLVAGQTGSGKSTSIAAMIGHRNRFGSGHIITLEDPIEYVHEHEKCIVSQRDIGIDTHSLSIALKNALRQQPDVILIGEIRDMVAMEHAINFSETGHLCLATIHANNASQAVERIINFFPDERHAQVLLNLSLNLRGILAQRLVYNNQGRRSLAIEVMLSEGVIPSLIRESKIKEIRDIMEKNRDLGMQTFDQALLDMYYNREIEDKVAISESDNPANVRLGITKKETLDKMQSGLSQKSKTGGGEGF